MSQSFLVPSCPLGQLILDLNSIYAEKNRRERMFATPIGCLVFLAAAFKAVGSEITKHDGLRLPSLIPNLVKRLFVLVELWGIDFFLETLKAKYPASGCSYCGRLPCTCGKAKAKPWTRTGHVLSPDQTTWSLLKWQTHHLSVYGPRNKELSPNLVSDRLNGWLNEEFFEAFIAIGYLEYASQYKYPDTATTQALNELHGELPDIFMRALALANHCSKPFCVETNLVQHYQQGCPKCHKRHCVCPDSMEDFGLFEQNVLAATGPIK